MKTSFLFVTTALIALVAGILIGARWLGPQETPPTQATAGAPLHDAGPFRVRASVDPETPEIGENTVIIEISDLDGAPVTGAQVEVVAIMSAMGAMPAMRAPATITETAPGRYEGPFTLAMDGSWPLTLTIGKQGLGHAELRFDATGRSDALFGHGKSDADASRRRR
jgi:Cu(I)/Ag(I) efflux system membrane fusion protein